MLHTQNDLESFAIHATDGILGQVSDFYFDDKQWVVRYLEIETSSWLPNRKVVLSPISIEQLDRKERILSVSLSREQVKNSPSLDITEPISRQDEMDYLGYYRYPLYWKNTGFWGGYSSPYMIAPSYTGVPTRLEQTNERSDIFANVDIMRNRSVDHQLRSSNALAKYHIQASDGEVGFLQGMLIDVETWAIRYLIMNTSKWWPGHLVLIAPKWIKNVEWNKSKVFLSMTQEEVRSAPIFDPAGPFNRELRHGVQLHYEPHGQRKNNLENA